MTTIAYRDGVMAADSRVVKGAEGIPEAIMPERAVKLFRLGDGAVAGVSGQFEAALRWLDAAKTGGIAAAIGIDIGDQTTILTAAPGDDDVHGGQHLHLWSRASNFPLSQPVATGFYAMGSGKAAALGALYAGVGAIDAVRIAALIDPYTGGEVMSMTVNERRG